MLRDTLRARSGSSLGRGTPNPARTVLLWLAGVLVASAVGVTPNQAIAHPRHREVDKIFARFNQSDSPGCAVAVMKNGVVDYAKGYGMADLDHGIRIWPSTVFHAASLSKQVTALAVMLLEKKKMLSLDDPVRWYVPELPDFGTPITIAHALGHTSGLRDHMVLANLAGWRLSDDVISEDDLLWLVSRMKDLNFTPGQKWDYSNTGYTLAARIVRQVSGVPLAEFAREHIFKPLKMNSTVFRERHGLIVPHHAYGYWHNPTDGTLELRMPNYDFVGPSNLLTTVEDLARWDANFDHMTVGGADVIRRMLTKGRLNDGSETKYGLGVFLGKHGNDDIVEHDGRDAGYRVHLIRFPARRLTVACLCNLRIIKPDDLVREVADVYMAKALAHRRLSADLATPDRISGPVHLAARAGMYRSGESDEVAFVSVEAGALMLGFRLGHGALVPVGDDRFRWSGAFDAEDVELRPARAGRPAQLIVRPEGEPPVVLDAVPVVPVAASDLTQLVGRYYSEELDVVYHIRLDGSSLVVARNRFPAAHLVSNGENTFLAKDLGLLGPSTLVFTRDSQGTVGGFDVSTPRARNVRFIRAAGP